MAWHFNPRLETFSKLRKKGKKEKQIYTYKESHPLLPSSKTSFSKKKKRFVFPWVWANIFDPSFPIIPMTYWWHKIWCHFNIDREGYRVVRLPRDRICNVSHHLLTSHFHEGHILLRDNCWRSVQVVWNSWMILWF